MVLWLGQVKTNLYTAGFTIFTDLLMDSMQCYVVSEFFCL